MSSLALDLQSALKDLDPDSAAKLELVVRDAIALARAGHPNASLVDANGWPLGHFEKYAGCLAGEAWDPPADSPPDPAPF